MSVFIFSSGFSTLDNKETQGKEIIHSLNVDPVYSWLIQMQQANGLLLTCEGGKNVSLMAVAFIKARHQKEADKYLSEMKKNLTKSQLYPGTYALPYSVNYGSSYADDVLWEGVDTVPAVSSSVWYLFAAWGFDPLKFGYRKNIPEAHRFWSDQN